MQYNYGDDVPTHNYKAFAEFAGCTGGSNASVFGCLVNADTTVLQNASGLVSQSGEYGTFAFVPVTDGEFVQARPSEQLLAKEVQGKRILIGVRSLQSQVHSPTNNVARITQTRAFL